MNIVDLDKWKLNKYSEIGQANPMRWMNLKAIGEDTFTPVSYLWKCKDFLNDAVVSYHTGKSFTIYGFQVGQEFFNKEWEGMPVLLFNVEEAWLPNIMDVVNPYLESQGMPVLEPVAYEDKTWFVNIPQEYLANTFYISQVTLFIRMANQKKVYQTMDELGNVASGDLSNYQACKAKPLGKLHKDLKKYLYYWNDSCHYPNKEDHINHYEMHDCGVVGWGWK